MICENCVAAKNPIPNEATLTVWCPTWITADEGPRNICAKCNEVFDPNKNPNAKDGDFFYDEEAKEIFKNICFIPKNDERYQNAIGMMNNSSQTAGGFGFMQYKIAIVDGKFWMANHFFVANFGSYVFIKRTMPNLYPKTWDQK